MSTRKSGQYWVKIKWPTAVNGYIWIIASYTPAGEGHWFFPGIKDHKDILEVDEEVLVYVEKQYRTPKEYWWPDGHNVNNGDHSTAALLSAIQNIGHILQDIHQELKRIR